jgi:hypothetical protein
MQKLFTKTFSKARMEYSTSADKFETTYRKPVGMACGPFGLMVHIVVDVGWGELDVTDGLTSLTPQKMAIKCQYFLHTESANKPTPGT